MTSSPIALSEGVPPSPLSHRLLAVLILIGLLLGGYAGFHFVWLAYYEHYQTFIVDQKNWLRRYQQAEAERPFLEQALIQLKQSNELVRFYLPNNPFNLAAADLQQRVQQLVQRHGGVLSSSQVLPPEEREPATRVALRVQFTAGVDNLHAILQAIESSIPLLFIDELKLQARIMRVRQAIPNADPNSPDSSFLHTNISLIVTADIAGYLRREGQ